jgi:hypothetical protein
MLLWAVALGTSKVVYQCWMGENLDPTTTNLVKHKAAIPMNETKVSKNLQNGVCDKISGPTRGGNPVASIYRPLRCR